LIWKPIDDPPIDEPQMSVGQYARFLIVGAFVGMVTVGCRELIGHLLADDTPRSYSVSVILAYAVGIALSFLLNHRFTFGAHTDSRTWRKFLQFAAFAVIGLCSTWALSLALRYGTPLDALAGRLAKPLAFASATLLSSLLIYPLNSRFVFGGGRSGVARSAAAQGE
jgi:putative flippase GtrA